MNWKTLDWTRRNASPVEVDLIESYASGKISRRNFIRRGTMIGVGGPVLAAVIAACGSDDADPSATGDTSTGSGDEDAAPDPTAAPEPAPTAGGDLRVGVQFGDANSGLDPLNMLDGGTYGTVSQSFEYLVGLADDGGIGATALATGWSVADDAMSWTFNLREGVMWQDGTPFTSADVAATIDRMVEVGAGIAGVVSEGAVETPDEVTAVVNLDSPNGNLPVLLSLFNPQSLITPADFSDGTTLDARPTGTGAWMLDSFDATTFTSVLVPNPNWWGGEINLDSVTLLGFESAGTMVAAMSAREINMIQQFSVIDGGALLNDEDFTVLRPPSAAHRQLWFNTQLPEDGPFSDPRVRKAVCLCLNRQQIVDTLYEGEAVIANDHPVHPSLPFFDEAAVAQVPRDIEQARALLAEAGFPDGLDATLQVGNLFEIPDMAAIVEQNCAEAGINLAVGVTENSDFYGEYWCTGASYGTQPETSGPGRPCGASAEIGIVDYGHRPTPDIYFGRALQTDGDWNSSNYTSSEFDSLFNDYQGAVDVEGQTTAVSSIMQLLHDDVPACYPIFFNFLSGHDNSVSGVQVTALSHMKLEKASVSA